MRTHTIWAARLAAVVGVALAAAGGMAGCLLEEPARAHSEGSCFIGGCAHEVCSARPDVVSPCIWKDVFVCYRTATCARQSDGACDWSATPELSACVAAHDPSGSQP